MARTWQEVTELPEYQTLSDVDKERARQEYFYSVVANGAKSYEEIDQLRSDFDTQTSPTPPGKDSRSIGETVVDAVKSAASGANTMAQGMTWLAKKKSQFDTAVGGAVLGDDNPFVQQNKEVTDTADRVISRLGDGSQYWQDKMSDTAKAQTQELSEAKGIGQTLNTLRKHPALISDILAGSTSYFVPMVGQSRLLTLGGVGTKAVAASAIGTGAALEGADSAISVEQQIKSMDEDQLNHSRAYLALIGGGATHEEAVKELAEAGANKAFLTSAALSALASLVTGGFKMEIDLASNQGLRDSLLQTLGKQAAEEGIQEGGNQLGQNVGLMPADERVGLLDDVDKSTTLGVVAGTGIGAGGLATGYAAEKFGKPPGPLERAAQKTEPTQQPLPGFEPTVDQMDAGLQNIEPDAAGLATTANAEPAPGANEIHTNPESQADIDAQVKAMNTAGVPKDSVFVAKGSPMPSNLPKNAHVVEGESGTLITRKKNKAELFKTSESDRTVADILGYGQSKNEVAEAMAAGEQAHTLVVNNKDGIPIHQEVVTDSQLETAQSRLETQYPGQVVRMDPDQVLAERRQRANPQQPEIQPAREKQEAEPVPSTEQPGKDAGVESSQAIQDYIDGKRDDVPTVEEVEAESTLHFKSDGSPFVSEKVAQIAIKNRRLDPDTHSVVPHGDGFAIQQSAPTVEQSPVITEKNEENPTDIPTAEAIEVEANEAATSPLNDRPEPTEAQKEAGNYKKGHVKYSGIPISIENPAGSKRRPEWPTLKHHYGDLEGTKGADGDAIDVFINKKHDGAETPVFIINQSDPSTGKFDEHKVMLGFKTPDQARRAYLSNYTKDWVAPEVIPQLTMEDFKAWLKDGDTTKPYEVDSPVNKKSVKTADTDSTKKAASEYNWKINGIKVNVNFPIDPKSYREIYQTNKGGIVSFSLNSPRGGYKSFAGLTLENISEKALMKKAEQLIKQQWPDEKITPDSPPAPPAEEKSSQDKNSYGAENKVFTADAAEQARALLKKKLGQMNSGIDPEVVQAGITLAGFHIEAGARKFADFTKAMVSDLGENVRPYLRSWYEGVRYYPGFDAKGMSTAEEIDQTAVTTKDNASPEPSKGKPKKDTATASKRQQSAREFVGVEDGSTVQFTGEVGYAKPNKDYKINKIDKAGSIYVSSESGSTVIQYAELLRAKNNGVQTNPTKSEPIEPPAQQSIKQGKVGGKMSSGEIVLTTTQRKTTPFPQIKTGPRNTSKTVKNAEHWLMDNAIAEAESRGDEFNLRQFMANRDKPSQADKDSAEYYLFDPDFIQPVPKSFTKPLMTKSEGIPLEEIKLQLPVDSGGTMEVNADVAFKMVEDRLEDLAALRSCVGG